MKRPSVRLDAGVGFWRLTDTESKDERCLIVLNAIPSGPGFGLVREHCDLASISRAVAWRPVPGGLELIRSDGGAELRLMQRSDDLFSDASGRFSLALEPLV